jgi:hypothetical protein
MHDTLFQNEPKMIQMELLFTYRPVLSLSKPYGINKLPLSQTANNKWREHKYQNLDYGEDAVVIIGSMCRIMR